MAKMVENEDYVQASKRLDLTQKYANGVSQIDPKVSPAPYTGRGWTGGCHHHHPSPAVIPVEKRQLKYVSLKDDAAMPEATQDEQLTTAEQFLALKAYIAAVKDKVKKHKAMDTLPAENLTIERGALIRLQHMQALVDSAASLLRTMKAFDGCFDKNDRCNTTCQTYCQQACQNSCQNNSECHDQKCGVH